MRTLFHRFRWLVALLVPGFHFCARAQTVDPVHHAVFLNVTLPNTLLTGQVFTASLTVSNAGSTTWRQARPDLTAAWELRFLFDRSTQGWSSGPGLSPVQWIDRGIWEGVVFADQIGDHDAFVTRDVRHSHFSGATNDRVAVRVYSQGNPMAEHNLKLYWTTTGEDFYSESKSIPANYSGNDAWGEIWFEVGTNRTWSALGMLTSLRLNFAPVNHGSRRWLVDEISVYRGEDRITEESGASALVPPGAIATFAVQGQAPSVPGVYPLIWRMVEEKRWFDESPQKIVQVVASTNELAAARDVVARGLTSWHTGDGLPHNLVQALAQTADGYLWIGTQKGLARFDGARFTVFGPRNLPALRNANITALCAGRAGSLWIGTDGGGVTRWQAGAWTHFAAANGLAGNTLRCIYEARDGAIWFGTTAGLSRWQHDAWTTWGKSDGMSNIAVRSLCEAENGDLWIGTGGNLHRLADGKITEVGDVDANSIRGLWRDRDGALWVASNGGLFCRSGDHVFSFSKADGLEDGACTVVWRDRQGTLWVGNAGGLNRLAGGRFVTELTSAGEGFDLVNAMLEDREGNFWIGGKDGLHRLRPLPFTTYTRRHGLSHNNVISVCEDVTGTIWAGTWGGGVNQLKDEKFTTLATGQDLIRDQANEQILALCPLRDGSTWVGFDYERGLARWQPEHGFVESYPRAGERPFSTMRVILRDRKDTLWLGTRDGLYRVQNQKFHRFGTPDGLPHDGIRAIFEDHEGTLWIGTQQGVVRRCADRFEKVGEGTALARSAVVSFYEDEEHAIWMGTTGAGLRRFKDGKLSALTSQEGLFTDDVHGLLADDFGNFWMGCRQGVFRASQTNLNEVADGKAAVISNTAYGLQEGLVSTECNIVAQPSVWKSRDGRLWFATAKGLSVVDPQFNLKINENPPPVFIEEVIVDKSTVQVSKFKVQSQDNGGMRAPTLNVKPETLHLPPGRGELEFHYTAVSFTAPEKNRFKYRLEGFDRDWVDAGTRRIAYYNNLRPGAYTFRVIACNNEGVWNALGSSVTLSLLPYFWQTWWFRAFATVIAASGIAAVARVATTRKLKHKLELLERQQAIEKERTRIARDMHDDLGSRLTQIILLTDRAQNNGAKEAHSETHAAIKHVTRDIAQNLDAIVWAVNPRHDTLDKTILYLWDYMEKYLGKASLRCRAEIPDPLPDYAVSSETRHNLFLIIKEALNNIAKHSGASEAWFRVELNGPALSITVDDNGRGFSMTDASDFGNGLQNMEALMKSIGGAFKLSSDPGKGTRVGLKITLPGRGLSEQSPIR